MSSRATAGPRYTPQELSALLGPRYPPTAEQAPTVSEAGLRAGFEPTTRLLTEAPCWQLADAAVRSYDGAMSQVDRAPSTVTDAVLHLAGDLAEHLVGPDELSAWTGRFFAELT